jgi:hypothetical protein
MPRDLRPCGTWAAAKRHALKGEKICDKCLGAQAKYLREWRKERKQSQLDRDLVAVREILRILDSGNKVGLYRATTGLRKQFAKRLEDLDKREKKT